MVKIAGRSRRSVLQALAGLPALAVSACAPLAKPARSSPTVSMPKLVDAHCHLFNVTDLPVWSFVLKANLRAVYSRASAPARVVLERAFRNIERTLLVGVPGAAQEAQQIRFGLKSLIRVPALSLDQLSDLRTLISQIRARFAPIAEAPSDRKFSCERPPRGPSPDPKSFLGWLVSLRSTRADMAARLTRAHVRSGYTPALLCPALVDFSNWLDEAPQSPLPDQVRVAGALSRRPELPAIHGYVAFDPLRHALIRAGKKPVGGDWDPIGLVRQALTQEGFLGVKLYPPMGFRPSGNAGADQGYTTDIERKFGSREATGRALEDALEELWRTCDELDAPILAHAANSNYTTEGFGRRADPAFWLPVLKAHPRLRVMLGHFGRFGTLSDGQACEKPDKGSIQFAATWEAAIGRHLQAEPASGLFADISYFSEMFDSASRARSIELLCEYRSFDRGMDHLVFGSDWVMLGVEKRFREGSGYTANVVSVLRDARFTEQEIDKVMIRNALRFLGLDGDTIARRRILTFYAQNGLQPDRLPGA